MDKSPIALTYQKLSEKDFDGVPFITIDEMIDQFPKRIDEKINRTLLNLSRCTNHFGEYIRIGEESCPLFYAVNIAEMLAIRKELREIGYIDTLAYDNLPTQLRITAKGFDRIYELDKVNSKSRQAFVAMWFDPSLNKTYTDGFEKAIKEAGYESKRIDRREFNNKIDDEIIAEIKKSKFLVSDFTGHRGGVYYESGFAHGLGIPVIFTCRKDCLKDAHFDTEHYNHITWENEEELYKKLLNRIRATIL